MSHESLLRTEDKRQMTTDKGQSTNDELAGARISFNRAGQS